MDGENRACLLKADEFCHVTLDITNDFLMDEVLKKEIPHTVIHVAAVTQADECQLNQENCEAVNVRATAKLLLSAESFSKHFIYLSTDFVFDGEKGDYTETDDTNPVSWYGFTKLQGESIVETSDIPFTIIRTCQVMADTVRGTRSNIVTWVKKSLEEGKQIKVVNDQWRTPTFVEDLATGILLIVQKGATGLYHISGKNKLTPYEMALKTAAFFKLDASLIEKQSSKFLSACRRPAKTGFDISKAAGTGI